MQEVNLKCKKGEKKFEEGFAEKLLNYSSAWELADDNYEMKEGKLTKKSKTSK